MKNIRGPLFMFISAIVFSISGLFIKLIPWQALSIGSGRCIFSSIFIALYIYFSKSEVKINKNVLIGGVGMFFTLELFVMANKLTTAANSIVLQFVAPAFVIIFNILLFHKKPNRNDLLTCLAVMGGIVLVFIDGLSSGNTVGNLLALGSGVAYSIVFMLNSFEGSSPITSILIGHIASAIIGFPTLLTETNFSFPVVGLVIFLGIFQIGLGYILFNIGLKETEPLAASLISGIEPVVNPIWVALFYHEIVTPLALVGCAIVLLSNVFYNIVQSKDQKKAS